MKLTISQQKRIRAEAIERTAEHFKCQKNYIWPIIKGTAYQNRTDIIEFHETLLKQLEKHEMAKSQALTA